MIESIVERGADINARNDHKATPLHYCVTYGKKVAAEILIPKGADIHARNRAGGDAATLGVKKSYNFIKPLCHIGATFDLATLPPMSKNIRDFLEDLADPKQAVRSRTKSATMDSRTFHRRLWQPSRS